MLIWIFGVFGVEAKIEQPWISLKGVEQATARESYVTALEEVSMSSVTSQGADSQNDIV